MIPRRAPAWIAGLASGALALVLLLVGAPAMQLLFLLAAPLGMTIALSTPERLAARLALPLGFLPEAYLAVGAFRFWSGTGSPPADLLVPYALILATLLLLAAFTAWAARPVHRATEIARALSTLRLVIVLAPAILRDDTRAAFFGAGPAPLALGVLPLVPLAMVAWKLRPILRT